MIQLEKKQVKIISILIAVLFIGSVVAIALTQSGTGVASAAGGNVGVIDYRQVMSQHPDLNNVEQQMQTSIADVKREFEEKSAGMNDQEKADYYQQSQLRLQQRQQELVAPIEQSIQDAIKKVADNKGLQIVVEKTAVIYGGQDISQDVINRLGKK